MKISTRGGGWFDDEKGALGGKNAKRRYNDTCKAIRAAKRKLQRENLTEAIRKETESRLFELEAEAARIEKEAIETYSTESRSRELDQPSTHHPSSE
jgi:hypothetical protein